MDARRRYLLISPCRDEAAYLRRTLDSVARQTIPPTCWVVVDDGSTDDTTNILAEYAAKLAYLRVIRRPDRGRRAVGPGVIDAFYAGLETVRLDDYDYLCKLDMDLDLCHRARMLGWIAESVDEPELRFLHLRPMGASQGKGIGSGRVRAGFGQHFMGTSPLYYLAVAMYRLPKHPMVYGSLAMLWGYFSSKIKGAPRYEDPEFRRFLRRYQHACLWMGKAAASRKVSEERAALWQRTHGKGSAIGIQAAS